MSWVVWCIVFGITLSVFVLVMLGMALGVMFGRRGLAGSCGGLANLQSTDTKGCSLCSHRSADCKLRDESPIV